MNGQAANATLITKQMFRRMPSPLLLAVVSSVNGFISSFFASNYIGVDAMGAVGLYGPISILLTAVGMMLMGGSSILCGKYMGKNEQDRLQNVFSLTLVVTALIAVAFTVLFVILGALDLTGLLSRDAALRPVFNLYLLGQAAGVIPFLLGNQLPSFLNIENRNERTMAASLVCVAVNVALGYLFVITLRMGIFGLALASSAALWAFLAVAAMHFLSGKSHLRFTVKGLRWSESVNIIKTGIPSALGNGYQTIRGLVVNRLILLYVGGVGISAFAAAGNLMSIFWSVPTAMLSVSRMQMSVSIGEEDRQTLTDIMGVMFRRFIPLMCAICAGIILCAVPLTRIFFRDPADPVYTMTVWGLRILPLCMPFSIIMMHFTAYGQASGKKFLVHALSLLDGVVCVAGFTALLIPVLGLNSVYIANVLNGIVTTVFIVGYAWWMGKRFPRNMEQLMVIPEDFGASEDNRMDLTVRNLDEVILVSEQVQNFCRRNGVDPHRSFLAGLCMEEMAGNVVEHGFPKDRKKHTIDLRVVLKNEDVILRIKDDCVPFDPGERQKVVVGNDVMENIGIRMVFRIAQDVQYQNVLGINVLNIRI